MSITLINLLAFGIFLILFTVFTFSIIVSYKEKEDYAVRKLILLNTLISIPLLVLALTEFDLKPIIVLSLTGLLVCITIIILLPIKSKVKESKSCSTQIDERDVMFSRAELSRNPEKFEEYYTKNPQLKENDDQFRSNPGLLGSTASLYHQNSFEATKAVFSIADHLQAMAQVKPTTEPKNINPSEVTAFIKNWVLQMGAVSCGVCELEESHKYSTRGRREHYGKENILDHKYAIAFTVEMDKQMMDSAPLGTTVMESARQYVNAGIIANSVAGFIGNLGYEARAHIDGDYQVICPLVARDAGLGELGRMGLLMTPELGPRVRIAVITSSIPLEIHKQKSYPEVIDFCNVCKKCADVCPSNAISFDGRKEEDGAFRWKINQEKCFEFWSECGTDCGRCMSVCPFSHPNNLLHNIIRKGIANSRIFARVALKLDDYIYGRKPDIKKMPKWLG